MAISRLLFSHKSSIKDIWQNPKYAYDNIALKGQNFEFFASLLFDV